MKLEPASPMKFLRASLKNPDYAHVLSARRQIFVQPTEDEIPETVTIEYGDTTYRIYICDDSLVCNKCKKSGHKTEKCKLTNNKLNSDLQETQQSQIQNDKEDIEETTETQNNKTDEKTKDNPTNDDEEIINMDTELDGTAIITQSQKRGAPSDSEDS